MMENLRAASNHVALKIILSLIIVSFVLTGVSGYIFKSPENYVVQINDQEISPNQLDRAIQADRDELRSQYESQGLLKEFDAFSGSEDFIRQHRASVLNKMIDDILISQYAQELNIAISNEQVKNLIRSLPEHQVEGVFDNELYQQKLYRFGISGEQYADYLRKELEKNQVQTLFGGSDFALPLETKARAELFFQKRFIRTLDIDLKALEEKQNVSDEELENAYQQEIARFAIPERYKVSYLKIDAADVQDDIKVNDENIKEYYEKNINNFTQAERYNFSIIQLASKEDAEAIITQLNNGADFAALAKEKSTEVVSAKEGGELGWYDKPAMLPEMVAANLTAKGQLSAPITSNSSYLVFRLNDFEEAKVRSLAEATDIITKTLSLDKAKLAYYGLQQKVGDAIHNDAYSLEGAAKESGIKIVTTDWFDRNSVPEALDHKEIANLLFSGALNSKDGVPAANSDLIQVNGDRAFVLHVDEYKAEEFQTLDKVRAELLSVVKSKKAVMQSAEMVEAAINALREGKPESEVVESLSAKFSEQIAITRQDGINRNEIGRIINVIFEMTLPKDKQPSYEYTPNTAQLIALDKVESGQIDEDMMSALTQQIAKVNNDVTYSSLLMNLRQQAQIDYDDSLLR